MGENSDIREPTEDEVIGKVEDTLGANRLSIACTDGEIRVCRIPGKMQKSEWIRTGDYVLVEPWSWQEEKADVTHRYSNQVSDEVEELDEFDTDLDV